MQEVRVAELARSVRSLWITESKPQPATKERRVEVLVSVKSAILQYSGQLVVRRYEKRCVVTHHGEKQISAACFILNFDGYE